MFLRLAKNFKPRIKFLILNYFLLKLQNELLVLNNFFVETTKRIPNRNLIILFKQRNRSITLIIFCQKKQKKNYLS